MAPGRLYRDYSLDDDYHLPPRRLPSVKETQSPPATPRTVIKPDEEETGVNGTNGYNTTKFDYDEPTARREDGYHAASADQAIRNHAGSPYSEAHYEPILEQNQVDTFSNDGRAPAPAVPTDASRQRGFERNGFERSVTAMSDISRTAPSSDDSAASRLPEFFSHGVFQTVLNNPTISHQLLKFCQSRLCGENMEFLARVSKYHALLDEVSKAIFEIHKNFISGSAQTQINLPEEVLYKVNNEMKSALTTTMPSLESIFIPAQSDVERLVYGDIYPKFVRYQMSISAAKALGGDTKKYTGLGDCFVLTDPSKADNPILYVSDGFAKVTGYSRNEIIPRNCRFLQTRHTDRAAVRRLKAAIDKREESVELLLNQKKNGEPFWNLLYTTPLFDQNGKLVFFLGGQINCSTSVHSASDVLRILAESKESSNEESTDGLASPQQQALYAKPARRSILSAFRTSSRQNIQQAPGMEGNLVNKLEDMPLKDQMNTFYTAYSNFIVINYSSYLISFISSGIVDLLFPIKAKSAYHAQAVGTDIFKFLANHGSGNVSWDFKSSVKGALKMGNAISLDLKLCARPYMGFERFVMHWTPLKNEHGAVIWVIVTLGNQNRV